MLGYLYSSALKDFLRPKRIVVWVLVAFFLGAAAKGWSMMLPAGTLAERYGQLSSVLVYRVMALAAAIFSTAVVSQEVEQKTIVYLLTRPVPRWQILLMRTLAAATVVFVLSSFAALCVSAAVFGPRLLQPLLFVDLKALAIGALAYGGLFVFVSLLMNRAMIVCLLFAFGWETAIPNVPGYLYYVSVYSHLSAIAQHPKPSASLGPLGALSGQLSTNSLTPTAGWTSLIGLTVVTFALSCWWFSRFEYVPREDAE